MKNITQRSEIVKIGEELLQKIRVSAAKTEEEAEEILKKEIYEKGDLYDAATWRKIDTYVRDQIPALLLVKNKAIIRKDR